MVKKPPNLTFEGRSSQLRAIGSLFEASISAHPFSCSFSFEKGLWTPAPPKAFVVHSTGASLSFSRGSTARLIYVAALRTSISYDIGAAESPEHPSSSTSSACLAIRSYYSLFRPNRDQWQPDGKRPSADANLGPSRPCSSATGSRRPRCSRLLQ